MSRVFANSPGDCDSISGRVIPKTQKMVLDATLLKTKQVRVKSKVEQSNIVTPPLLHLGVVAIEKGAFKSPSIKVVNFTYIYIYIYIFCVCVYMYICTHTHSLIFSELIFFLTFFVYTCSHENKPTYIYIYIYICLFFQG